MLYNQYSHPTFNVIHRTQLTSAAYKTKQKDDTISNIFEYDYVWYNYENNIEGMKENLYCKNQFP